MKIIFMLLTTLLLALFGHLKANSAEISHPPLGEVAPYPNAMSGMSRQAIYLPHKKNEENLQVELIIGKNLEMDCNSHQMTGELKINTLEGWGYHYWVLEKLSEPMSTLMTCPDNSRQSYFVRVNVGDSTMQRYNSALPLVLYVPQDVVVKYRIWQAEAQSYQAQNQ